MLRLAGLNVTLLTIGNVPHIFNKPISTGLTQAFYQRKGEKD